MPVDFERMPGFGDARDLTYKQAVARRELITYAEQPFNHTPELVTAVWQGLWNIWQERTGIRVDVPNPNLTLEEIRALEDRGRMLIYLPEALSGPDALSTLQKLLPGQNHPYDWEGENSALKIKNLIQQSGWLSVEKSEKIATGKTGIIFTNEKTLEGEKRRKGIEAGDLVGQTVNTYVVGSVFHKLITGRFYDQQWSGATGEEDLKPSLLPGSRVEYHDERGGGYLPYAVAYTGDPRIQSWESMNILSNFSVWGWNGPVDYDAVRTVEVNPKTPNSSRRNSG